MGVDFSHSNIGKYIAMRIWAKTQENVPSDKIFDIKETGFI